MSNDTLRRITNKLDEKFRGLIDMSDHARKGDADQRRAFLSRALAALAVHRLGSCDPKTAANSIVDGGGDFGLDAIFYDGDADMLYFVQSKWSDGGHKGFDQAAALKMVDGIKKILADDFSGANNKLQDRVGELRSLTYSSSVKFCFVTIHVGMQDISFHARDVLDRYVLSINESIDIAEHMSYNQKRVFEELVVSEYADRKISLTVSMRDFGCVTRPYTAYYGRVNVLDIADWWQKYKDEIFIRNVRKLIPRSDINDALADTLAKEPDIFWYYNNGITLVCDAADRQRVNIDNNKIGIFDCRAVSVVNGAQTVGVIGQALSLQDRDNIDIETKFRDSWVNVRIIPLGGCPEAFDRRITESTNLQNSLDRRDFAALDSVQKRLAMEFILEHKIYAYRNKEEKPADEEGCTIVEATHALACANSMELAVQAKREVGSLLSDTSKPPYTDLFNSATNCYNVWKSVTILRAVDSALHAIHSAEGADKKAYMIATHLNRAIANLVFSDDALCGWDKKQMSKRELQQVVHAITPAIFQKVLGFIKQHHDGDYLASFAKNRDKCVALKVAISHGGLQGDLFGGQ